MRTRVVEKHYSKTEEPYLHLCPEKSGYMSMGLWPAESLKLAQENLLKATLKKANLPESPENFIVELGCGWGGNARFINQNFSNHYIGINFSRNQLEFAKKFNDPSKSEFVLGEAVETYSSTNWQPHTLLCLESAFHFENKIGLMKSFATKDTAKQWCLAEICMDSRVALEKRILVPSLSNAWSQKEYESYAKKLGLNIEITDVSQSLFQGLNDYIWSVDDKGFQSDGIVLNNLKLGFESMLELSLTGHISYCIINITK